MIRPYDRQIAYLDRVRSRRRLAHGYLFYGPDRAGMLATAKALARSLCCAGYRGEVSRAEAIVKTGSDGCRDCAAVDADTHQSVILLDVAHALAPPKETRKEISIDDIRELKRRFSLAALGDAWRIAIINGADTMSRDAEVAFLKLLEEPGEQALFLLMSASRESVAPTIASRAVPLGFLGGDAPAADADEYSAVRAALGAGIPEALLLSENMSGDRALRAAAIRAVLDILRERLSAAVVPEERRRLAACLARVLDIAVLMETTNVNPRLALDAAFLEHAALGHDGKKTKV